MSPGNKQSMFLGATKNPYDGKTIPESTIRKIGYKFFLGEDYGEENSPFGVTATQVNDKKYVHLHLDRDFVDTSIVWHLMEKGWTTKMWLQIPDDIRGWGDFGLKLLRLVNFILERADDDSGVRYRIDRIADEVGCVEDFYLMKNDQPFLLLMAGQTYEIFRKKIMFTP